MHSSGVGVTRLSTSGSVQSVACLPRSGLAPTHAFGGASAGSAAATLDANLHVLYATASGSGTSSLQLRSLLTEPQLERLRRAARELAEERGGQAAAPLVDAAPVVASVALGDCGGVSRLACLSDRLAVATTGAGDCAMIEIGSGSAQVAAGGRLPMRVAHTFAELHSGSATGLAAQLSSSTPLVATCSDDGGLALLAPFTRTVLARVPHAHPSALYTCTFGAGHTLHAAGMGGVVSSWDLRVGASSAAASGLSRPALTLLDPNAVSLQSLCAHPTRPELLACGSSNGSVSIFDLRGTRSTPICSIQAQRAAVLDLSFVSWRPLQLLTASEDGSLCAFDFGAADADATATAAATVPHASPFSSEAAERTMKPTKILQNSQLQTNGAHGSPSAAQRKFDVRHLISILVFFSLWYGVRRGVF